MKLKDGQDVTPLGVRGLHLVVQEGRFQRLIRASDCQDEQEFWKAWKAAGGGGIVFEDGTPYEPPS